VEPKPCASATQETILRMTAVRSTTWMTTGFFRFNGHGNGGLCMTHEKWRRFPMLRTGRPASTPGNRAEFMPAGAHRTHPIGFHPAQPQLLLDRLQTQNA
jgi:hypothetical protein